MKVTRSSDHYLFVIVILGTLPFILWWLLGDQRKTYTSWQDIGSLQALGGPHEAWIFVESRIVVHFPGWLVEQPNMTVARKQEAIVITPKGLRKRIAIPGLKEPTFHPNIGRIFRGEDGFYLLQGKSMGLNRSIFQWREGHFELLPLEESEALLKAYGLADSIAPEFDPSLERLSETKKWKILFRESSLSLAEKDSFTWDGRRFQFELARTPGTARLVLHCITAGDEWDAVLLEVPTTPKEITRMQYNDWNRLPEPGHPSK